MARLEEPVMNTRRRAPASRASSTAYWMSGLSTMGSISLGLALVAGRKRVPLPATGNTATSIRLFLWAAMAAPAISGPETYHSRPPKRSKRRDGDAAFAASPAVRGRVRPHLRGGFGRRLGGGGRFVRPARLVRAGLFSSQADIRPILVDEFLGNALDH